MFRNRFSNTARPIYLLGRSAANFVPPQYICSWNQFAEEFLSLLLGCRTRAACFFQPATKCPCRSDEIHICRFDNICIWVLMQYIGINWRKKYIDKQTKNAFTDLTIWKFDQIYQRSGKISSLIYKNTFTNMTKVSCSWNQFGREFLSLLLGCHASQQPVFLLATKYLWRFDNRYVGCP